MSHHSKKVRKKKKFAFTRWQIGAISFTLGCGLVGLYIYSEEQVVALGGLVSHLWVMSLPVVGDE